MHLPPPAPPTEHLTPVWPLQLKWSGAAIVARPHGIVMFSGSVSVDVQQNCASNFPKRCRVRKYEDWYKVGPYCVKYFNTSCSFPDAEFACREKATGGHLVSVHDEQANSDVNCIVMKYNYSSPRIWLGGMELFQSKKFIWTDGSVWDFKKWVPGQPDNTNNTEDCVEMNWKTRQYLTTHTKSHSSD
uniref:C-type lectin domain-containing protein n=1 Tax=Paramormyrops kingsleyae TaxID=1676925 RepID=A0A3B3Q4E7_9TELE